MEAYLPPHPKYGYNASEQLLMVLITGVTNFAGIPAVIMLFRTQRIFEGFLALFTVFTSFMYHAMESISAERIFLNEGEWHRLDNVGSITCFMMLFVHLMDFQDEKLDLKLYMTAFIITILAQEKDPWNLNYTIVPIVSYLVLFLLVLIFRKRKPMINHRTHLKSLLWMVIAVFNFSQGLDEYKDHLRFFHGMWHMCVGISSFYFWQIKLAPGEEFSFLNFWKKKYTYRLLLENKER